MAVAQLLLSMEPKYICHNQCTMGTSSPIVPKLSTEILLIPAILELYHKPPLKKLKKYILANFHTIFAPKFKINKLTFSSRKFKHFKSEK